MVLAHPRKEIFTKRAYNRLKFKKIGPCGVLRKFSTNAYEIELPPNIGISPIFNVADLYRYEDGGTGDTTERKEEIDWLRQLPTTKTLQPNKILDKILSKNTRGWEYFEYLIKWKDQLVVEATWITDTMLQKLGSFVEELMDRSP